MNQECYKCANWCVLAKSRGINEVGCVNYKPEEAGPMNPTTLRELASRATPCMRFPSDCTLVPPKPTPEEPIDSEVMLLRQVAYLIGSIFTHGNFVAETQNERELETLLRQHGDYPWTPPKPTPEEWTREWMRRRYGSSGITHVAFLDLPRYARDFAREFPEEAGRDDA